MYRDTTLRLLRGSSRTFTTSTKPSLASSAASTSAKSQSESRPSGSTVAAQKEAKKKDKNLRRAIEIYHLTDRFFPAPQKGNKKPLQASTKEGEEEVDIESDDAKLASHIRDSIGISTGAVYMRSALTLEQNEKRERSSLGSTGSTLRPFQSSPISILQDQRESSLYDMDQDGGLPSLEDGAATADFISKLASREALLTRQQQRLGSADNASLDSRSARVRDALYGTIGGELPGLEIIRERMEERKSRQEGWEDEEREKEP